MVIKNDFKICLSKISKLIKESDPSYSCLDHLIIFILYGEYSGILSLQDITDIEDIGVQISMSNHMRKDKLFDLWMSIHNEPSTMISIQSLLYNYNVSHYELTTKIFKLHTRD